MNSEFQAYIEAIAVEECQTGATVDRSDSDLPSSWHREPPMLRPMGKRSHGMQSRSSLPGEAIAYHGLV